MDRSNFTYVGSSVHETIAILRRELKEGDAVLVKGTSAQRLERVILALQGRNVRCPVETCHVNSAVRWAAPTSRTRYLASTVLGAPAKPH